MVNFMKFSGFKPYMKGVCHDGHNLCSPLEKQATFLSKMQFDILYECPEKTWESKFLSS